MQPAGFWFLAYCNLETAAYESACGLAAVVASSLRHRVVFVVVVVALS